MDGYLQYIRTHTIDIYGSLLVVHSHSLEIGRIGRIVASRSAPKRFGFSGTFSVGMAAPLFGDKWYEKSKEDHAEANEQFKAAVASARSATDEGVRQVGPLFYSCTPFL